MSPLKSHIAIYLAEISQKKVTEQFEKTHSCLSSKSDSHIAVFRENHKKSHANRKKSVKSSEVNDECLRWTSVVSDEVSSFFFSHLTFGGSSLYKFLNDSKPHPSHSCM